VTRIPGRNVVGDQVIGAFDASGNAISGVTDREAAVLIDRFGNPIGVTATPLAIVAPDTTATGTITTADAAGPTPGGLGVPYSGAPTANSFVAVQCPGGDSSWTIQIGGTLGTSPSVYFEISLNSTNGSDGDWINVNGRQTGVLNTVLVNAANAIGIYRGNTAGVMWLRVRIKASSAPNATVAIRISDGVGATFLNAAIPAGNNFIGHSDPTSTRLPWHLYVDALLAVAGDALITTQRVENISGTTAPTAATAHVVPAGYRLRITAGNISVHTAGTAQFNVGVRLRINTAGAAALTSPIYALARAGLFGNAAPIANAAGPPVPFVIPNGGIEIPAGGGYAVSQIGVGTLTSTALNMSLVGYLYPV
jgi:hypothetical protein